MNQLLVNKRHTATRLYHRLRDERGFEGGYTIVPSYVAARRQQIREMFVTLSHPPGNAQADFGVAYAITGGMKRKVHLFASQFVRVGKGNDKGKVENLVGYFRRNFMVPLPCVETLEELNAHLLSCCQKRRRTFSRVIIKRSEKGCRKTSSLFSIFLLCPITPAVRDLVMNGESYRLKSAKQKIGEKHTQQLNQNAPPKRREIPLFFIVSSGALLLCSCQPRAPFKVTIILNRYRFRPLPADFATLL